MARRGLTVAAAVLRLAAARRRLRRVGLRRRSAGVFFFSSRRRHTRWPRDWSSDVCSSDLNATRMGGGAVQLSGKVPLGARELHWLAGADADYEHVAVHIFAVPGGGSPD